MTKKTEKLLVRMMDNPKIASRPCTKLAEIIPAIVAKLIDRLAVGTVLLINIKFGPGATLFDTANIVKPRSIGHSISNQSPTVKYRFWQTFTVIVIAWPE